MTFGTKTFTGELTAARSLLPGQPGQALIILSRAISLATTQAEKTEANLEIASAYLCLGDMDKAGKLSSLLGNSGRAKFIKASTSLKQIKNRAGALEKLKSIRSDLLSSLRGGVSSEEVERALVEVREEVWYAEKADYLPKTKEMIVGEWGGFFGIFSSPCEEICDFCFKSKCTDSCDFLYNDVRTKLAGYDWHQIPTANGFQPECLHLATKIIIMGKSSQFSSDMSGILEISNIVSHISKHFSIDEHVLMRVTAIVRERAIPVAVTPWKFVLVIHPSLRPTHSCCPNASAFITLEGKLLIISSLETSEEPGIFFSLNLTHELLYPSLPFPKRSIAFKKRFDRDCTCERCISESSKPGNFSSIAVVCLSCEEGLCSPKTIDKWICDKCQVLSVKPGLLLRELESELEEIFRFENLEKRSKSLKLLKTVEIKLGSLHWMRGALLSELIDLYLSGDCSVIEIAEGYSKELLSFLTDTERVYIESNGKTDEACLYMFNILRKCLLLQVIGPSAEQRALILPPVSSHLPAAVEDSLEPLLAYQKHYPYALRMEITENLRNTSAKVLPIAVGIWKREPHILKRSVRKVVVIKALSDCIANDDTEGFENIANNWKHVLGSSIDKILPDEDISLLAFAVRKRRLEIVRILINDYHVSTMFAGDTNWGAFHEIVSRTSSGRSPSIDDRVKETKILKELLNGIELTEIKNIKLHNDETLLHLVDDVRIARILVRVGCDINAVDTKGRTVSQAAKDRGNEDLVNYFNELNYFFFVTLTYYEPKVRI